MDVGIGLPNTIPGTEGSSLIQWAERAEEAGFSSLGTIGRLVYPGYDDLIALAAAAAVTGRIRLTTSVLLGPLHTNTPLLAKQAASLDRLSGGRLVLGVGLGSRDDDYVTSGLSTTGRGRRLDEQLDEMKRIWGGEERGYAGAIGPPPAQDGGPELIIGGHADASLRRAARFGDGWIMSGGTPELFSELTSSLDRAWRDAGRSDKPRTLSLAYFSLGPKARENAEAYLKHYYAWLGEIADQIAASAAIDAEMVRSTVAGLEQSGCDEVILVSCSSDPDQVGLLAEAIA
jgi:alkanesulfonate monooxygenase SsuD/methylene tetrahydromethanopterin reductase-like flavin-dependent oxidoreductase (luciferase family)